MKFLVYKDKKSEWRWRLIVRNGRIIADSSEGYKNKSNILRILHKINPNIIIRTEV